MQTIVSSGNPIVDAIGQINITGNIVPASWFRKITLGSGRPDTVAIIILSELLYWYRPKETRTKTGRIEWSKKFKKDYLQKNIKELCSKFNFSYDQVKSALKRLEDRGYIVKHLRNETIKGTKYGNVLYIEVVPEMIQLLMVEDEVEDNEANNRELLIIDDPQGIKTGGSMDENRRVSASIPEAQGLESWTNTKNTTENTAKDFSSIIEAKKNFMNQIDYESLIIDCPRKQLQLMEIVELATEVLTSSKPSIAVNGEQRDTEYVKDRYRKLDINSIKYVLESLGNYTGGAANTRAFLITTLFNAPATMDNYYELAVNHDLKVAN